jgi:PAS domain S-box-containing protein
MKRHQNRLISKAEAAFFAVAFATLLLALVISLFLAQGQLVSTARYWDFLRVERYMRLCQLALEAQARAMPSEESLQKLRDIGLYLDVYPPDHEIPQPNPRFVQAIESVEMWDYVRDPEGKPVAVIRLSRHDINTRHTLKTVRLYTAMAAIGGLLLIAIGGFVLRRTVMRSLDKVSQEIKARLPVSTKGNAQDPLDELEQNVRALIGSQEHAATRSKEFLDGHREMLCVSTREGEILEVNDAYCRFFSKQRENLVGTNYLDLIPPPERADALGSVQKLSLSNPVSFSEHRVLLPDGSTRWVRWRDTAVFRSDGTIRKILSYGTDISPEKNLAEQIDSLRVAFAQMQSLAETGSLTWDFAHDRMEWTEETQRLLGVDASTPASIEGLLAVVAPDDRETLQRLFHEAKEQGRSFQHEFRAMLADGSLRVLQSRAEVLADPKTKLLNHLTCTLRDITALRDAEAATKRELRFREAVEKSLAVGIVVRDMKGCTLSANPAFTDMVGFSEQELIAAAPPDEPYWPDDQRQTIEVALAQALASTAPKEGFQLVFNRKDQTRFDALVAVAPVRDDQGVPYAMLGAVTDISSIQKTRRELAEASEELRRQLSYREAMDKSTTVGLIAIGLDGRPFSLNDAYAKMFGYTAGEILAWSPPYPCWPEDQRASIQKAFSLHLEGKTPPEGFQLPLIKKDGTPLEVLITTSPIKSADGKQIGILSALTEVTLLQQARRELQTANERMRIAQDVVGLGIWDWDPVADTLFWDKNSFALFGHPEATDPKKVWTEVHSEEERERLTYELTRLIQAGGENGQDRLRIPWPDGSEHNILSTYVILRDASGKANRVIGVNRDVTTELEQEQELRVAQERLYAALEGGKFGTFEHVFGLGAVNWNSVNYEIHGIDHTITDPDELFRAWMAVVGHSYPAIEQAIASLHVDQTSVTYDFEICLPRTGEKRRVRSSVFIERNKNGHPVRLVGVSRLLD